MTYAEAMQGYGIDKPDLRLPRFWPVEDLFPADAGLTREGLPLVAIHIPSTGALSRKERDELKDYGRERGLTVYDDPKRLERDFPGVVEKVRERTGAGENDLLLLAGWRDEPKGSVRKRRFTRRAANCGCMRARSTTTGISCWIRPISGSCGCSTSRCLNGTMKTSAGWRRTIRSRRRRTKTLGS